MRIAIQFFGHLRTFKKCWPYLQRNLLAHYDCDIFMHTWDTMNHNCPTGHFIGGGWNRPINVNQLRKRLGIGETQLIVEKQHVAQLGDVISSGRPISIGGMNCLWYSMQAANKLRMDFERKNNVQYDYVVCVRPDVFLNKSIDIPAIIKSAGNPTAGIFCLGDAWHVISSLDQVWMTDVLFFGRPNDISQLMDNLPPRLTAGQDLGPNGPEMFFTREIGRLGLGPFWMTGFVSGRDFWILRPIKWGPKRLLRIHMKKQKFEFILFDFLPFGCEFKCAITHRFNIKLRLGTVDGQGV